MRDPERRRIVQLQFDLIEKWFVRERSNDPGVLKPGSTIDGMPTDPLHPWNRPRAA